MRSWYQAVLRFTDGRAAWLSWQQTTFTTFVIFVSFVVKKISLNRPSARSNAAWRGVGFVGKRGDGDGVFTTKDTKSTEGGICFGGDGWGVSGMVFYHGYEDHEGAIIRGGGCEG